MAYTKKAWSYSTEPRGMWQEEQKTNLAPNTIYIFGYSN